MVLEQPYHQSFPYIHRDGDRIYVLPEASASGCLYRYEYDAESEELVNRQLVVEEPLLDSTFVELDGNGGCYAPSVADTATVDCLSLSPNGLKVRTRLSMATVL